MFETSLGQCRVGVRWLSSGTYWQREDAAQVTCCFAHQQCDVPVCDLGMSVHRVWTPKLHDVT